MKIAALALAGLLFAGCTQLPGINKQGHAGITDVKIEFTMVDGKPVLTGARWVDGKEKQNVALRANVEKGTFSYTATNVEAFEGQAFRAEVEKVLAENQGKAVETVAPLLMNVLKSYLGGV